MTLFEIIRSKSSLSILIILFLLNTHIVRSQQKKLHKNFDETPLHEVIKILESDFNLKFSYDPVQLKLHTISGTFEGKSIESILRKILETVPFGLKKTGEIYLIIPNEKPITPKEKIIEGRIIDAENDQPLAYVNIKTGKYQGDFSNQFGTFRLKIPSDTSTLTFSYQGYKNTDLKLSPSQSKLTIHMSPDPEMLPEVILYGQNVKSISQKPISSFSINPEQISSLPSLGEVDVFKTLQLLPGISATNEASAGLNVRGSSSSQNLILFDGVTIYHVDHFLGIFSAFNPNTIQSIDVFKGGFSPEFGGRASSVVDIKGKTPQKKGIHGSAGLNTSSINFNFQSRLNKRASILLGFRRSHYDVVKNNLYDKFIDTNKPAISESSNIIDDLEKTSMKPKLNFYDLTSKIRLHMGSKNTVDFNLYTGRDIYESRLNLFNEFVRYDINDSAKWSNLGLGMNWKKDWEEGKSSSLNLGYSKYKVSSTAFAEETYSFIDEENEPMSINTVFTDFKETNEVSDLSLKWEYKNKDGFHFGTEVNNLSTNYNGLYFGDFSDNFMEMANIYSFFGNQEFGGAKIRLSAGVRYSYYDLLKANKLEPRVNLSIKISEKLKLRSSASTHNQYTNNFSGLALYEGGQPSWVLANKSFPILTSNHFISGLSYQSKRWMIDLEGYAKYSKGLSRTFRVVSDELDDYDIPLLRQRVFNGSQKSIGIDLLIKRNSRKHNAWISYSLSSATEKFNDVNDNLRFPSDLDQKHEINITNMYKLGRWELSSVFLYGSGTPYTVATGRIHETLIDAEAAIYNTKNINARRLPAYHRLDISAKYKFNLGSWDSELGLTLFNVYNRKNVRSKRLMLRYTDIVNSGQVEVIPIDVALLGLTPNIFFNVKF